MDVPDVTARPESRIAVDSCGLVDYEIALAMQRSLHTEIAEGQRRNTLLLLEHPPVFTAGRRTLDSERPTDGTPVIDTDRGGKITWHGPGQLVGYPIVRLIKRHDVVGFVREIEGALIDACADLGLKAESYCERSGVWVRDGQSDRKLAAIGIRFAKGVTMHGFALNVNPDLTWFDRIVPCGIPDVEVTSLSQELGRSITVAEVLPIVQHHMEEVLRRIAQ